MFATFSRVVGKKSPKYFLKWGMEISKSLNRHIKFFSKVLIFSYFLLIYFGILFASVNQSNKIQKLLNQGNFNLTSNLNIEKSILSVAIFSEFGVGLCQSVQ